MSAHNLAGSFGCLGGVHGHARTHGIRHGVLPAADRGRVRVRSRQRSPRHHPRAKRGGVSDAYPFGRLGFMVGPLVGGVLIAWKWDLIDVLYAAAVPAGVATLAIAAMYLLPSPSALL